MNQRIIMKKHKNEVKDTGRKPVHIEKSGNVTVSVFEYTNKGKPIYHIPYEDASGAHTYSRRDLADAKVEAARVAARLAKQELPQRQCDQDRIESDARSFRDLQAKCKKLKKSPHEVVLHYGTLVDRLEGIPLEDAVDSFLQSRVQIIPMEVSEIVEEFGKLKRDPSYKKALMGSVNRFARDFSGPIDRIKVAAVRTWLDNLANLHTRRPLSDTTRKTIRGHLSQFFDFAREREHLHPEKRHIIESLKPTKPKRRSVIIIKPDEMAAAIRLALEHAPDPDCLLHLVLAGFAGLRTVELYSLRWEDIKGPETGPHAPQIDLGAGTVKSNTTARSVEVVANLRKFLAPFRLAGLKGPIFSVDDLRHKTSKLIPRWVQWEKQNNRPVINFAWKRNFLRRGYAAYRLAVVGDRGTVRTEMGNTDFVLLNYYLTPVFKPSAEKYWSIVPPPNYDQIVAKWLENQQWNLQIKSRKEKVNAKRNSLLPASNKKEENEAEEKSDTDASE